MKKIFALLAIALSATAFAQQAPQPPEDYVLIGSNTEGVEWYWYPPGAVSRPITGTKVTVRIFDLWASNVGFSRMAANCQEPGVMFAVVASGTGHSLGKSFVFSRGTLGDAAWKAVCLSGKPQTKPTQPATSI